MRIARALLVAVVLAGLARVDAAEGATELGQLAFDRHDRHWRLRVPPGDAAKRPLLLVLHGGGVGSGEQAENSYGFDALADRDGVLVAYPDGCGEPGRRVWNDGRRLQPPPRTDDVGFLSAMIDAIDAAHGVDRRRIASCGISMGAMMSQRLAVERPDLLCAIAAVAGTLPALPTRIDPTHAMAVLMIHGTADRFVPYDGGPVMHVGGGSRSVADTIDAWRRVDGLADAVPTVEKPAHRGPADAPSVVSTRWGDRATGRAVELYRVEGGGHTWPGNRSSRVLGLLGDVTMDIDATALIWGFVADVERGR